MKNLFLSLLFFPIALFGQNYVQFPTNYDSESTANAICKGKIKKFLSDTVEWTTEKKNDRWVTSFTDPDGVNTRINRIFKEGYPEYSRRTNGGYWFYISIIDRKDEFNIIRTLKFEVDPNTQKIKSIEVYIRSK